ncbi:MAG: DUF3330 domain-containing protein [Gammaproteobacteria bacterium]|nr:DUF3330 domain-containing protein [Gammaproteobacteria bacterium]
MGGQTKGSQEKTVSCEVCMKEIPVSEAKTAEAVDYVAHFCGLQCFEKWRHHENGEEEPRPGEELD